MPMITRFEEIQAWQTARELTRRVYAVTGKGALARDYGLRDQLQRASVSIMSNIAEGFESGARSQFLRFLGYAKGSAGEVRAQLYVALDDVAYIDHVTFDELADLAEKCSRQLSRFIAYLRFRRESGRARRLSNMVGSRWSVRTLQCSNANTF